MPMTPTQRQAVEMAILHIAWEAAQYISPTRNNPTRQSELARVVADLRAALEEDDDGK